MIAPRLPNRSLRTPALFRRSAVPGWWRRLPPAHLLWLAIWAPWWLGNDVPPPAHPRSRELEMTDQPAGSPGDWLLETLDDLKLRFGLSWAAALLIRGAWLGGVAGIGRIIVAMLIGAPSPTLTQLAILVGIGAGLGLALPIFHRPRYTTVALLLERSFQLRSRISTAILALRYGSDAPGRLHALQLADAANTLDRTRGLLRPIHWVPVREVFIAFIVALTLLLLLVARRPEGEIPAISAGSFPGFVPVSERLAAQQQPAPAEIPDAAALQEVEDLSRISNQARQDLDAIRDALDDTAQTQPAANAIASEDYPVANQHLTEASDAVTQLPDAARESLADQLDDAADRVDDNGELADAARSAAQDVRSGQDERALDELGDAIERTGEDVIPQQSESGELAAQSGESQSGSSSESQSGGAEQPESAEQGSGGDPGESGDPGAGMDASSGTGQPGDSSQGGGEGGDGGSQSSSGEGGQTSEGGQVQQDAESQGSAGASEGQPGDPSDGGEGSSGEPGDQESGDQGAGAAAGSTDGEESGESGEGDGATEPGDDENADESSQGEAGDPPLGGDGEGGDSPVNTSGGSSIQLSGTGGERVSSGSDIGASSVGSGGGVGAASGDSTAGVSGSSGPDPNTVPAEWRDVVERYFQEGGAP